MTGRPQPSSGRVPLIQCSVLYIGSAVPLETVAGLDSFKIPLRERYTLTDGHLLGIDATLTVYSAGILVQYTADSTSSAWFPIQALHICAALKAFRTPASGGLDFDAVNSSLTKDSRHPPVFAFTNRRTKGIKVLECHMFLCRSIADATTLVQTCMQAYEHEEGWLDEGPFQHAGESLPKIVPADAAHKYVESGFHTAEEIRDTSHVGLLKAEYARVPLQGFLKNNRQEFIHEHNVYGQEENGKQRVGETNFRGHRTFQESAAVAIQQQPPLVGTDSTSTFTAFKSSQVAAAPRTTQAVYVVPEIYLTGVNPYGSVPLILVPATSFYPDQSRLKQKKKQSKISKSENTSSKCKSLTRADEESEDEIIEEYYYVRAHNAPTYQSPTVQKTRARDDIPRRMTMDPRQKGSMQSTSRCIAGEEVDHQYITRSVPNILRIREGSLAQQQYLHGSFPHTGKISISDLQHAVEAARTIECGNVQPNRIILEEPIPDYPTEPNDLYLETHQYDTGFHRPCPEVHRSHERETRSGGYSRITDKLESPRELRHLNDNLSAPSREPEDKRGGYAALIGDLGYLP